MKFSIICPVYNNLIYIDECVRSVVSQTFKEWELILIDDGSTDGTGDHCDKYSDKRIRVFHKKNEGQYEARLFGVQKATGDYICFLDSDDLLSIDALEKLKVVLINNHVDLVSFNYKSISDSGLPTRKDCLIDKEILIDNNFDLIRKYFFDYFLFSVWSTCFKKDLFSFDSLSKKRDVGRFGEDTVLVYQLASLSNKAVFIDDILYFYRMNNLSISHKKELRLNSDRVLNLNFIYDGIYQKYGIAEKNNAKLFEKASWPILNYVIGCALEKSFKDFRKSLKSIFGTFLFKHYFKTNSLSGKYSKIIARLIKIRFLLAAYHIIRIVEKRKKIYEKSNY